MKTNIGGRWYQNVLRTKRQGGWIAPKDAFVKAQGVWTPFRHTDVIRTNNIHDLVTNGHEWVLDPQRGWYRDIYPETSGVFLGFDTSISQYTLSLVRKISATFTGYYKTPLTGMHHNYIRIILSNGTYNHIGTNDAWTDDTQGLRIYGGDAGEVSRLSRNVINERFTYTVPAGLEISKLEIYSYPTFVDGIKYPSSLRGMKDFEFILG